jgi:hypothetical protein
MQFTNHAWNGYSFFHQTVEVGWNCNSNAYTRHKFVLFGDTNEHIGSLQDVFATASTPMSILDAKYEKANINATIISLKQISGIQQQQMKALLYKFEHLNDGTLGNWKTVPVSLQKAQNPFK